MIYLVKIDNFGYDYEKYYFNKKENAINLALKTFNDWVEQVGGIEEWEGLFGINCYKAVLKMY